MIKITEKYMAKKAGSGFELIEIVEKSTRTIIKDGKKITEKLSSPVKAEKFLSYPSTLESLVNAALNNLLLSKAGEEKIYELSEIKTEIAKFREEVKRNFHLQLLK